MIQVRPNSSSQSKNEQQTPVRSAEEALQILESHRNQNEEVTPTTPQPPVASQPIVIQVQVKPTPEKDSTTTPITSPRVRSDRRSSPNPYKYTEIKHSQPIQTV